MPIWHTSSKQGELGVWLVLVVNGREALETHSFEDVLEFIERPADRTLQEVERQHWADILAAAPREYEESKRLLRENVVDVASLGFLENAATRERRALVLKNKSPDLPQDS